MGEIECVRERKTERGRERETEKTIRQQVEMGYNDWREEEKKKKWMKK